VVTDTAYFFRTRENARGILQILGVSESPPGVKIRYKLVQPAMAASSSLKPIPPDAIALFNEMKALPETSPYKGKTADPQVKDAFFKELAAGTKKMIALLKGTVAEPLVNQQQDEIKKLHDADKANDKAGRDAAIAQVKSLGLKIEKLFQEASNHASLTNNSN
jgi:hypothetical protein